MRTVTTAIIVLASVGCAGTSPAETVWASCNQDVPGYSAVLDGSTVTIQGEPDATRTVRRLDMEAAACTLGRAGAPDEVWGQVVSSTVADPIRREQWEGWEVTWSVQHGAALNMTVRSR